MNHPPFQNYHYSNYPLLSNFNLYGWRPDPFLSDDENYMDIVLLVTRSSTCTAHGHVGCLLVNPSSDDNSTISSLHKSKEEDEQISIDKESIPIVERLEARLLENVLGAATNASLFHETDSDIHAEIACLGQACKNRNSTEGCTAYITIHPCKRCFAALVAFGVKRIVSRRLPPGDICRVAEREGIAVAALTRDQNRSQMKRINELVNSNITDEELMAIVERRRKWRKDVVKK